MAVLDDLQPDPIYPERASDHYANKVEEWGAAGLRWLRRQIRSPLWRARWFVTRVRRAQKRMSVCTLDDVREAAVDLAYELRRQGLRAGPVARAFALVRVAAGLTLGKTPFDVQLMGGWTMLQGMIAEMQTGEGKTLTATLPAATVALAGLPVHVVTTNDYLVSRDAESLAPLYQALGLTVAAVTADMDEDARREAYRADVVYCSNKTVVFDYLRDQIVLDDERDEDVLRLERLAGTRSRQRGLYLRGLCYAVVDEADSVLVDEARTPLIISGVQEGDVLEVTRTALDLAQGLGDSDFLVLQDEHRAALTESGRDALFRRCAGLAPPWNVPFRREELVVNALTVLHLYRKDEQYIVQDGKIVVVDEFTGRTMADRSWGQGLHQMIELKEGLELTDPRLTLKSISYQRFFRHYLRLSGMTGTAQEIRGELGWVYDLPVVTIPTNKPCQRRVRPDRVLAGLAQKWAAVCDEAARLHAQGVPILIGTRTVAASEQIAAELARAGVPAVILNAKQNADEAALVARAGEVGSVMIATNMAGRGTDIPLSDAARRLGGLHVILTERHESARIDRQLQGRCARQGDPGCAQAILSLEDTVLDAVGRLPWAGWVRQWVRLGLPGSGPLAVHWLSHAQARMERHLARERGRMVAADQQLEDSLSFSGHGD
ncbi:Protein translocase subunit SecA OS=Castellaniella defragrans OX=75697 GN=secA PE=3 SV=1 [Castellaniella defragrans]